MSTHPVLAALAGVVLLGQGLAAHEWAGIGVVVAANVVTVDSAGASLRRARARVSAASPARHVERADSGASGPT